MSWLASFSAFVDSSLPVAVGEKSLNTASAKTPAWATGERKKPLIYSTGAIRKVGGAGRTVLLPARQTERCTQEGAMAALWRRSKSRKTGKMKVVSARVLARSIQSACARSYWEYSGREPKEWRCRPFRSAPRCSTQWNWSRFAQLTATFTTRRPCSPTAGPKTGKENAALTGS